MKLNLFVLLVCVISLVFVVGKMLSKTAPILSMGVFAKYAIKITLNPKKFVLNVVRKNQTFHDIKISLMMRQFVKIAITSTRIIPVPAVSAIANS
ncbi:hypothetical protein MOXK23_20850 [Moraxella sp. K23]